MIFGFSALCALLAVVVGITIIKVGTVKDSTERTVNLRVPTAMTASDLVAGVYASLASLRGWLITGNEAFKTERAGLWKAIEEHGSQMDRISGHWTVEQNKLDWKQAKPLLGAVVVENIGGGGSWLRAQRQGLPLQRIDLGLQLDDALTLPHMLR